MRRPAFFSGRGASMTSRLAFTLCAVLICSAISAGAQEPGEARVWLTTPDRSPLLTLQKDPLRFSASANTLPTIDVNDDQQYQPIDGFGFAVTGGSAQLLMRMDPAQRGALLRELFAPSGEDIAVSYLRVSIGSSDMNGNVYSYDDLPEGQTDGEVAKFSLGPDRMDVIPILKEILAI